ncbi:MAG: DUF1467 family protein [Micavibrio sp.]|nr:DUF1467 family protein [Micavibrio sp.]
MGLVSGITVFFLVWWTALFTVLPFSLKRDETGKPDDPQLWRKFVFTTVLSVVIWLGIYALIEMNVISFHDLAVDMAKEDVE